MTKDKVKFFTTLKECLPTFSGSIDDNSVNYLLELDLLRRMMPDGHISIGTSPKMSEIMQ